jgi:hypothetical protein
MGEKYLTVPSRQQQRPEKKGRKKTSVSCHCYMFEHIGGRRGIKQKKIGIEKRLTCERRADFSPANVPEMQQHALLERVENVLAGDLLSGLRPLGSGGVMAVRRCRVGRRWSGDEFDEEPAVLVRVSYSFVSITAEGQDSREKEDSTLNRTIHTYRRDNVWRECFE